MNKIKCIAIFVSAFLLALPTYGIISSAARPGDASDPLVSKAYVDSRIEELKQMITGMGGQTQQQPNASEEAIVTRLAAYFDSVYGPLLRDAGKAQEGHVPYETVFARAGTTLVAESGTEIILRGGAATAVTGINGLCDATSGVDLVSGMDVPLNHLLIVPASDGRGMQFLKDSYLMVKGVFSFVGQ